jgi:hypothetical protein
LEEQWPEGLRTKGQKPAVLSPRGPKLAAQTPGEQKPRGAPPQGSRKKEKEMEEPAPSELFPPLLEVQEGGELRKRHYRP